VTFGCGIAIAAPNICVLQTVFGSMPLSGMIGRIASGLKKIRSARDFRSRLRAGFEYSKKFVKGQARAFPVLSKC